MRATRTHESEYRGVAGGYVIVRKPIVVAAGLLIGVATIALVCRKRAPTPPTTPLPDCHTGPVTPGIDVSYYQDTIDWQRVQRAGIRFAFIRISDGATIRDPMFDTNWAESRRAGLVRGAYQFFRPDENVDAQAELMIAAMQHIAHDDLPPVLDIEVDGGLAPAEVARRASRWIDRVRSALDVEPIVYTGNDLWRSGGAEPLGSQPLWVAHYTQNCPLVPPPWTHWTFWQHTDRGSVPGIDGPVDLDLFAGTVGDLHERLARE